jgi:ribose transport system ATP-binding protein
VQASSGGVTFIGALFGAILIQEIITATTFLQIGLAWQYYLPGILILAGAGIYSRARRSRSLSVSGQPA